VSADDLAFEKALSEQLAGKDAAPALTRALALRDVAHGPKSAEALEVLLTLISEHARQRRPEDARKGLADLIARGAPGAEAMAGAFHSSFGDWAQAEEHYERALAAAGKGEERARLLHAVGRTRLELGRLEEGRATLAEAAREGCAAAAVDLSDALAAMGKVDEARDLLESARKTADQRWAVECTSRLGALYRASGNLKEAEKFARDTVMSAEELDGRSAALALFELAAVQAQVGKNAEALQVLERALKSLEAMDPRDDYAWAQAQLRVGCQLLYGFPNREAEAPPYLNRALGAVTRIAGMESPECAEVLVHLAVAAVRKADLSTAEGLAARSAALYERAFGPGNRFAAGPLNLLSAVRLQLGDEAGAKAALARAGGSK
jgi:tetratricopeptide (TPR) repeat protein